jgi:BNR repeat-like domain
MNCSAWRQRAITPLAACVAALCTSLGAATPGVDSRTAVVSGPSPFVANCNGAPQSGTLYPNAEVEPFVAANPIQRLNLVGVWQQDRWSDGGSQGLASAYSFDGGVHWERVFAPFTHCAGGTLANGGDYERGSDPWVSFSPNGVVHQMVLGFNPSATGNQTSTAMLASRSTNGGRSWERIHTLVADNELRFNDKNAITADPTDARYVYAVWDRLSTLPDEGAGPTLLARSSNNGRSWEPARIIYDPGPNAQTIGNRIEVLRDGTLVDLFTHIDYLSNEVSLRVIRSTDKGQTWSLPIMVADILALGASDPQTGAPIRDGAILAQFVVSPKGTLSAVWQDARFSGGRVDGVVLSQSSDGGLSWSAPVQINRNPQVQAFAPSIHVRRDGTIGVSYYDLRSNTGDPATLFTDTWQTRSRDGLNWRETRIAEPFDLARAPVARGYFLGDYQGLTSIGPLFIPFFAKSDGSDANRNDIYAQIAAVKLLEGAANHAAAVDAQVADEEAALPMLSVQGTGRSSDYVPGAVRTELRATTWEVFERTMRARVPDWDARRARRLRTP